MKVSLWTTILTSSGFGSAASDFAREMHDAAAEVTQTTVIQSVITPPPVVHGDLFKRAIATCGFVRGNSASPLTCPENYNCISTAGPVQAAFACCDSIECPNNWGLCNNYGVSGCGGFDLPAGSCSSIYGSILSCSSDAPYCYRYARSSVLGAAQTFYSYACGTASTDILVLATATNGANQQTSQTPSDSVLSIPGLTNGAFTVPGATESTLTNPTGGTSNSNGSGTGGGGVGGLSTTTIALIAVFGGGGILLVLAFACFCVWRRRSRHAMAAPPTGPYRPQPPPAGSNNQFQTYQQPAMNNMPMRPPPGGMRPSVIPQGPPVNKYPTSGVQELGAPVRPLYEMAGSNGGPTHADRDMNARSQTGGA